MTNPHRDYILRMLAKFNAVDRSNAEDLAVFIDELESIVRLMAAALKPEGGE